MVVISYGACQRDPIVQVGHGEANFIFPLCNYRHILLLLFLDRPSDYSLIQRPVSLHHRSAFRGESHLQFRRTRTKFVYRHLLRSRDRLAFDDVAARWSCGSYWRQLSASLPAAVTSACCQICTCALPLTARSGCGLSASAPRSWLQPVMVIGKLSGKNRTSLKVRYPSGWECPIITWFFLGFTKWNGKEHTLRSIWRWLLPILTVHVANSLLECRKRLMLDAYRCELVRES